MSYHVLPYHVHALAYSFLNLLEKLVSPSDHFNPAVLKAAPAFLGNVLECLLSGPCEIRVSSWGPQLISYKSPGNPAADSYLMNLLLKKEQVARDHLRHCSSQRHCSKWMGLLEYAGFSNC